MILENLIYIKSYKHIVNQKLLILGKFFQIFIVIKFSPSMQNIKKTQIFNRIISKSKSKFHNKCTLLIKINPNF